MNGTQVRVHIGRLVIDASTLCDGRIEPAAVTAALQHAIAQRLGDGAASPPPAASAWQAGGAVADAVASRVRPALGAQGGG